MKICIEESEPGHLHFNNRQSLKTDVQTFFCSNDVVVNVKLWEGRDKEHVFNLYSEFEYK